MDGVGPRFYWCLAKSADVAKALQRARPEVDSLSAVHLILKDDREFVVREGGETLEIERTGQHDQFGVELLVFKPGTSPFLPTDEQITEQRRLFYRVQNIEKAMAEGRVQVMSGLDLSNLPDAVSSYLDKSPEEQHQWIALDASTDEWNQFMTALESLPEPQQSMIFSLYLLGPHRDVLDRRHPSRTPRGSA